MTSPPRYATVTLLVIALGVPVAVGPTPNPVRIGVVASMAAAIAAVLVIPPLSQFFRCVTLSSPSSSPWASGPVGVLVILAMTPVIDRLRPDEPRRQAVRVPDAKVALSTASVWSRIHCGRVRDRRPGSATTVSRSW